MADEADTANEYAEQERAYAIRSIAGAVRGRGESRVLCLECEEPINPKRREASPGCTLCIECQRRAE